MSDTIHKIVTERMIAALERITAVAQAQRACDLITQAERQPAKDAGGHREAGAAAGEPSPAARSTAALTGPHRRAVWGLSTTTRRHAWRLTRPGKPRLPASTDAMGAPGQRRSRGPGTPRARSSEHSPRERQATGRPRPADERHGT
jgi:hypothetical protein